jgi:hypothetical protein
VKVSPHNTQPAGRCPTTIGRLPPRRMSALDFTYFGAEVPITAALVLA